MSNPHLEDHIEKKIYFKTLMFETWIEFHTLTVICAALPPNPSHSEKQSFHNSFTKFYKLYASMQFFFMQYEMHESISIFLVSSFLVHRSMIYRWNSLFKIQSMTSSTVKMTNRQERQAAVVIQSLRLIGWLMFYKWPSILFCATVSSLSLCCHFLNNDSQGRKLSSLVFDQSYFWPPLPSRSI